MAAVHPDQNFMLKALAESVGWASVHLISYEDFFYDNFFMLVLAFIVLLMALGIAYLIFYPLKKTAQDRNTLSVNVVQQVDESAPPHKQVRVPEKYREVFIQTMEEDLNVLNLALAEGRSRAVLAMLHRMHGALAALGIDDFAERCAALERDGRLGGMNEEISEEISALAGDLMRMLRWQ